MTNKQTNQIRVMASVCKVSQIKETQATEIPSLALLIYI